MSRKHNVKKEKSCFSCDHCIPIGEGDHICDEASPPKIVVIEYESTEDFLWCNGKRD